MSEIKEILTGWISWTLDQFNLLDEETKAEGERRIKICDTCLVRTEGTCDGSKQGVVQQDFMYKKELRRKGEIYNGCSCPLSKKVLSPKSKCPLGKFEKT